MTLTNESIPDIEDSYDKSVEEQSVTERYYSPRYRVNFDQEGEDYCVLFHSNRICVITLALTHVILTSHKAVEKIDYQVSPQVDRLSNTVSGKGKRGAQIMSPDSVIFYVHCTDKSRYAVRSCVPGKLVELNEQLITNPNLLTERPADKGYLAIILPTIPASSRFKQELLTAEQYKHAIQYRQTPCDS